MIFRAYLIDEDGNFFHKLSVTFETRVDYSREAEIFFSRFGTDKYFFTLEIESRDCLSSEGERIDVEGLFFASQIETFLSRGWCVRVLNCDSGEKQDFYACSHHVEEVLGSVLRKVSSIGHDYKFDRMVQGFGVFTVRA